MQLRRELAGLEVSETSRLSMDKDKNVGLGVLISMLSGSDPVVHFKVANGKYILKAWVQDNKLWIAFQDGTGITIFDDGQSCCEHRYMSTEDNLDYFIGAKFEGAEVVEAENESGSRDYSHEIQFLDIITDKGMFQIVNHNEHNGYYGGFALIVLSWKEVRKDA